MRSEGSLENKSGGKVLDTIEHVDSVAGEGCESFEMSMGLTLNKGDYAFARIDVSIELFGKWEYRNKVKALAKDYLEDMMRYLVGKEKGKELEPPKFNYSDEIVPRSFVKISRGETVPLKNYESARYSLSWKRECTVENHNERRKELEDWINEQIKLETDELTG